MWGGTRIPGPMGCSTIENDPAVCCSSILKSTPKPLGGPSQTDLPSPAPTTNFDMACAPLTPSVRVSNRGAPTGFFSVCHTSLDFGIPAFFFQEAWLSTGPCGIPSNVAVEDTQAVQTTH